MVKIYGNQQFEARNQEMGQLENGMEPKRNFTTERPRFKKVKKTLAKDKKWREVAYRKQQQVITLHFRVPLRYFNNIVNAEDARKREFFK